jgi:hypothetical protein
MLPLATEHSVRHRCIAHTAARLRSASLPVLFYFLELCDMRQRHTAAIGRDKRYTIKQRTCTSCRHCSCTTALHLLPAHNTLSCVSAEQTVQKTQRTTSAILQVSVACWDKPASIGQWRLQVVTSSPASSQNCCTKPQQASSALHAATAVVWCNNAVGIAHLSE